MDPNGVFVSSGSSRVIAENRYQVASQDDLSDDELSTIDEITGDDDVTKGFLGERDKKFSGKRAAWLYGNNWTQKTLQAIGTSAIGVPVTVESAWIAVFHAQTKVCNITVSNPPTFQTLAPYFLNCGAIYADIDWFAVWKTLGGTTVIDEMTVHGLTMYYDTEDFKSNVDAMLEIIHNNPVVQVVEQHSDPDHRFIIKKVVVKDLEVHVISGGLLMPVIKVPLLEAGNVGVKQNGVTGEKLTSMLVEIFIVEAFQHKADQIAAKYTTTAPFNPGNSRYL